MTTYRLDLGYDGSGFRGYAKQSNQRTVQGELELALGSVLRAEIETSVAGRTDAGVHARGQVVSFSTENPVDLERTVRSLNGMLGPEVAVRSLSLVEDDFHARFSARWRRYRYLIDRSPVGDPMTRHFMWQVRRELDFESIEMATAAFVGEHDFSAFCKSVEGRSNIRLVRSAGWEIGDGQAVFWIQANAFCHQMVRSIVGYLYDVGRGYLDPARASTVIDATDRASLATIAPPHGLSLWEVGYKSVEAS